MGLRFSVSPQCLPLQGVFFPPMKCLGLGKVYAVGPRGQLGAQRVLGLKAHRGVEFWVEHFPLDALWRAQTTGWVSMLIIVPKMSK